MKENYADSLKRLLVHEGGYTNHPADPGGPTNFGITLADYRRYCKPTATAVDVKTMTLSEAQTIYKSKYWDALRCDDLPSGVDYAVFDFGVNSGITRSAKYLQSILGVEQDGKIGDETLIALVGFPAASVVTSLCDARLAFLKKIKTWPSFGKGWARRVAEVKAQSLKLAREMPPPPDIEPVPLPPEKPVVKSTEIWAHIIALVTALGSVLTDTRFLIFVVVMAILYGIWRRYGRGDIKGWFK